MKIWEAIGGWSDEMIEGFSRETAFLAEVEAEIVRRRINRSLDNEPSMPLGKSWHNRPDYKLPEVLG